MRGTRSVIVERLPVALALAAALTTSGCYFFFEENLPETDVSGKVVIEAGSVGLSSFGDLSAEELNDFINRLGVVYVGAYGGLENRGGLTMPTFDPFSQNAFPYGGTTVGSYTYSGLQVLTCEMISGRFEDADDILTRFDLRVPPAGTYPQIYSRALVYEAAIADGEVDADEAATLAAISAYPVLTETEYILYLLAQNYFRYYNGPPNEGCGELNEDGYYDITSCDLSDYDFYGNVPWTVNGDGDLEAPFTIYKVMTPYDEASDTYALPYLWAFVDQDGSTCDPFDGYYTEQTNPVDGVYAGLSAFDTLNYSCEYITEGDLYTQVEDIASAPRVNREGTEIIVRLTGALPSVSDTDALDESLNSPYCGY